MNQQSEREYLQYARRKAELESLISEAYNRSNDYRTMKGLLDDNEKVDIYSTKEINDAINDFLNP